MVQRNLKRPKRVIYLRETIQIGPEGYTYLDRFMDEMKEQNAGEILFVATTIGDYKVMAEDMQELKRYIKQLGEVVIYYRNVTMPDVMESVWQRKKNEQIRLVIRIIHITPARERISSSLPYYYIRGQMQT